MTGQFDHIKTNSTSQLEFVPLGNIDRNFSETDKSDLLRKDYKIVKNNSGLPGMKSSYDDNSTQIKSVHFDQQLNNRFEELLDSINAEIYDEADETRTIRIILEMLYKYRDNFIQTLMLQIISNYADPTLTSELLSKLGAISKSIDSKNSITWLLRCCLTNSNPKIRYGAILGLSYMKSNSLLSPLRIALKNEDNPILKKVIENLISKIAP